MGYVTFMGYMRCMGIWGLWGIMGIWIVCGRCLVCRIWGKWGMRGRCGIWGIWGIFLHMRGHILTQMLATCESKSEVRREKTNQIQKSAANLCDGIFLHRCLQHKKANLKAEARKRDKATGETRLRNLELLLVLVDVFMSSSWFPHDHEFAALWANILSRR